MPERKLLIMGIFDGVLFLSDFDNTILYTAAALKNGGANGTTQIPKLSGVLNAATRAGNLKVNATVSSVICGGVYVTNHSLHGTIPDSLPTANRRGSFM